MIILNMTILDATISHTKNKIKNCKVGKIRLEAGIIKGYPQNVFSSFATTID